MGARDRSAPQPYRHLGCDECHRLVAQKKTPTARERDRPDVTAKRETFAEEQASLKANRLIFLDESGFRLGAPPHYGWAPIGEKSPGKSVQGAWQTMTMIGAIALDGFRGLMTVDAATNAAVFRAFVDQVLTPNLRPGDGVVMDNLSTHKDAEVARMIHAAGADVIFLPPYSPEYNPIEKAWAKIKTILRRLDTLTRESFDAAVARAMNEVSLTNIRSWIKYAGYSLK